ncbi:hypothetical protein BV25DRAFT_1829189 [Artomyces pyxidatus]|uniref:Uncharacterized protein n=1 Tax=Artomyces pyxidatus TaxID=48021 RepID=A0ACB8STB4_9AGAM|nr:hypothetical protein BV25DRAFT_1829189 [Artomyces pyxidatus]
MSSQASQASVLAPRELVTPTATSGVLGPSQPRSMETCLLPDSLISHQHNGQAHIKPAWLLSPSESRALLGRFRTPASLCTVGVARHSAQSYEVVRSLRSPPLSLPCMWHTTRAGQSHLQVLLSV